MGYIGWALDRKEVEGLKKIFKPSFPDVLAHHVTHTFGVSPDHPLPLEVTGDLYGYAKDDDGVEAFIVEIGGSLTRPDGKLYHVTWSIDRSKGFKPVDSNKLIAKGTWEPLPLRCKLTLKPSYFE